MSDMPNQPPQPASEGAKPADTAPTAEVLKGAFKAFKKRLKVTQLDFDSRIGRGPMSSGQTSMIAGITPPNQYPLEVWEELVKQGKLKHAGHGTYSLKS